MLSEETIRVIKSTVPLLKEHGTEITARMYELLFSKYPKTKELFAGASEEQPKKLANAIIAYATYIDRLEELDNAISTIARSHVRRNVKPEHYPLVKECLLQAIEEVLNPGEEVLKAWEEAYDFLAKTLITLEKKLYSQP
ncbi:globin domain-containing protein [Aquifex aeolicus]|uniref:Uncharacterized globin-like protein aq_211 n=1 Tax=Aquifex aeolicus (strain VF5) TaxID=224324 RepID=Y211_AQUAE|nr:globin domain-containing protein [Aquifex aeolicus]O66586.1 RecName: Full=Uncharacterized globin-like protein aq_211 [Aquifex aeolicus VF5]AAC06544.1 flavohemoprotein [Aquifex aeolicus VF5]